MDKPVLREIPAEFRPEAAVSGLTLLTSEWRAYLMCNAMRRIADGRYEAAGVGIYAFDGVSMCAFGWPNDEACRLHPVFGGTAYGLYDVLNSPWDAWVTEQNRYSFPHSRTHPDLRHFFIAGHDNSFNCLAQSVAMRLAPTWQAALAEITGIILGG